MKKLDPAASDGEILAAVREWVQLLAEERYQDAYDYLYHEDESEWSPALIEQVIRNYGDVDSYEGGETFKVTWPIDDPLSPEERDKEDAKDLLRFDDDRHIGHLTYYLPLNGDWSDVSAIFDLLVVDGALVLQLEGIRVM